MTQASCAEALQSTSISLDLLGPDSRTSSWVIYSNHGLRTTRKTGVQPSSVFPTGVTECAGDPFFCLVARRVRQCRLAQGRRHGVMLVGRCTSFSPSSIVRRCDTKIDALGAIPY